MNPPYSKPYLLNETEIKYVATCYPLPDRPGLCECEEWKKKLRQHLNSNNKTFEISSSEIRIPFPFLAKFINDGFFEKRSFQNYFEDTDELSHNEDNYQFILQIFNGKDLSKLSQEPKNALLKVLEHVLGCTIRIYDRVENKEWNLFGCIDNPKIDFNHFANSIKNTGNYYFLHGKSETGSIVIREINQTEFLKYKSWLDSKIKLKNENPFVKYRADLEKLLFQN